MPATANPFVNTNSAASPADDAAPVTPDNAVDLAHVSKGLIIGGAGDLKVTTAAGNAVTLVGVPAGVLPLKVTRVWATGTTATNISVLY